MSKPPTRWNHGQRPPRVFRRLRLSATALTLGCAFLALLALPACRKKNFTNENDRLRKENLELRQEVDRLRGQIDLRLAELEAMKQQVPPDQRPKLEGAEVPRVVALTFDRFSGAIDTNNDGRPDLLRLYVKTVDQKGRFLPAAGRAAVQVVAIRTGQEPVTLAEKTFEPADFEAAFRSGLTGTHYTLEVPLNTPPPADVKELTVQATFTDAQTGASMNKQQTVAVNVPTGR